MVNYNDAKIYKIEPVSDGEEGDIYIGSTSLKYLCERMNYHRNGYKRWKNGLCNKTTVYDIFDKYGVENCHIVLIELFNAKSKDELSAGENILLTTVKCVNKNRASRTKQEYYEDNKTLLLEKQKQKYMENKEFINERNRIYYNKNKEKINSKRRKNA